MKEEINKNIRKANGVIVSDKMDKTRVVLVERFVKDSKYKKIYRRTRRVKVHDENNEYKNGDKVIIIESRPISKDKRWVIKGFIKSKNDKK